jgi:hypothetical protein
VTQPPEQQQMVPIMVGDRARQDVAGTVAAVIATVVLAMYAFIVAGVIGMVFAMASDPCSDSDKQYICTPQGQHFVFTAPILSAMIGLGLSVIGCWVWPRHRRGVWLALGYLVAFTGFLVSAVIVDAAP